MGNIGDLRSITVEEVGGVPIRELQRSIKGLRGGRVTGFVQRADPREVRVAKGRVAAAAVETCRVAATVAAMAATAAGAAAAAAAKSACSCRSRASGAVAAG